MVRCKKPSFLAGYLQIIDGASAVWYVHLSHKKAFWTGQLSNVPLLTKGSRQKKNSGYNEFGTKGGEVSDLNHYLKQICNSEKGEGGLR